MFNVIFSFSKLRIAKPFLKQMYYLDMKDLNFEDEISIRRGECNTPVKTNLFTNQNLFHKGNQQRFLIKMF
jgi:hypothetical protein